MESKEKQLPMSNSSVLLNRPTVPDPLFTFHLPPPSLGSHLSVHRLSHLQHAASYNRKHRNLDRGSESQGRYSDDQFRRVDWNRVLSFLRLLCLSIEFFTEELELAERERCSTEEKVCWE